MQKTEIAVLLLRYNKYRSMEKTKRVTVDIVKVKKLLNRIVIDNKV